MKVITKTALLEKAKVMGVKGVSKKKEARDHPCDSDR